MATSGSVNTNAYTASNGTTIYMTFDWKVTSKNIAAKTTTISWTLKGGGTTSNWFKTRAIKLTIDGKEVYTFPGSSTSYKELEPGTVVATGTYTFTHAQDGTKSFTAYVEAGIYTWAVNCTGSKTFTLDKIPNVSVPTVSASSVDMGGKVTINTNREDSTLTHDLAYSFAGGSYVSIATGVGASYSWTTPDLASSIPNATSGTVTIRCITKSGGTAIGTKTVVMTLKVPASVVPTISAVSVEEATSGLATRYYAYIKTKSTIKATITAAGAKGSTIKSYSTSFNGKAYPGSSWTSEAVTASGSLNLVTTVTDSRGRTAQKTTTITVLDYFPPVIPTLNAYRVDAAGAAQPDGVYIAVAYKASIPKLNNRNGCTITIEYKRTASTTWSTLFQVNMSQNPVGGSLVDALYTVERTETPQSPTFSVDYQYDVRLTVTDNFGASTSYAVILPTADVVLDISSDGKGLGIGKVSQRSGATEFARVMYDRFDTAVGNGLAQYSGSGDNGIDPDTTLEHLILTDKNTPAEGFWYIQTLFYSTKSAVANRAQLALPYQADGSLWVRRYFNGAWSDWMGSPTLMREYDYGIWHVRYWSDGWLEMTGSLEITDLPCTTALGSWYRTAVFASGTFPAPMDRPVVTANYESDGYGALLWATTEATNTTGPSYYLIRPTSATIASGRVQLRVTGRAV